MTILNSIPPEIIHNILRFVDPDDLDALKCVCRFLYRFLSGNAALCRDIYLRILDKPQSNDLDWEKELKDYVKLLKIFDGPRMGKKSELRFVYDTITRLLKNSKSVYGSPRPKHHLTHPLSSRNAQILADLFDFEEARSAFFCRSFLFERARSKPHRLHRIQEPPEEAHQQSAKLHCLSGIGGVDDSCVYPFACSKVYDLRQYTDRTKWGPFMNDGSARVDWEKLEAILIVLSYNIQKRRLDTQYNIFANLWGMPFGGTWPNSYLAWPEGVERTPLQLRDPYDVSGTWIRIVCFVDYSHFFDYNFPLGADIADNVPRQPIEAREATRVILMRIHVTNIEPPGKEDGQELPVVHFSGISQAVDDSGDDDNANSGIRGTVRMTPEGEVRWTTISVFDGQDRWRSEGIQVGGRRSARGVMGNWFDNDYDPHGPCGPTGFWKISDHEVEGDDEVEDLLDKFMPKIDQHLANNVDSDDEFEVAFSFLDDIGILEVVTDFVN